MATYRLTVLTKLIKNKFQYLSLLNKNKLNKNEVIQQIEADIKSKVAEIQEELKSIEVEMSEETKSSAGDKFETSREMMNQSLNRLQDSFEQYKTQLQQLSQISKCNTVEKVSLGSFVKTENSYFLFGLAFGKINSSKGNIFALSLNSPLGRHFLNKRVGDTIKLNQTAYTIKSIE